MATTAAATYGADQAGLICGFLFDPASGARSIDSVEAALQLAHLHADDAGAEGVPHAGIFVWLHFDLAHAAAESWLQRHAGLDEAFFESLQDGLHSTRIERAEQSLLAVINDVHFDFDFEPSDIATLWISVDRNLVVTARRRPLRSVDQLRIAVKRGDVFASTAELLEHLLRAQADVLVDIVRGVTSRIDKIEDQLLSGRLDHKRVKLGGLRRLLVRLQRLLAPEPAALFRLLQHPPGWLVESHVQALRQSTEEFSAVLRDMAAVQERIKLLQEEIAASVNEDNGRSLFVLTIVTVLALPINIIAGLLGMNVGGVPLAEHPHGFWMVVAIVASFTAIAVPVAFRKRER
ncbi:MAG: transporter [Pseudomonadota bacterium]|nr:transporter [Pseudomonadota bacterium]